MKKISPKKVSAEIMQIQTEQIFDEIINISEDILDAKEEKNFTAVKRRTEIHMT